MIKQTLAVQVVGQGTDQVVWGEEAALLLWAVVAEPLAAGKQRCLYTVLEQRVDNLAPPHLTERREAQAQA